MLSGKRKEFLSILARMQKTFHNTKPKTGIASGEFFMLTCIENWLDENKNCNDGLGIPVSKISQIVKGSKPATSKMLNNLEEKGLIVRTVDKKDRRVVFVQLTDKGKTMLQQTKCDLDGRLSIVLDKLGDKDTDEFIRIMKKLSLILEESNGSKPF